MRQADHVAHLPAENAKGEKFLLGVHFVDMTPELINTWRKTVQPLINKHYSRAPKPTKGAPAALQSQKQEPNFTVITDKGKHSAGQSPVREEIQEAVEQIEAIASAGLIEKLDCAVGAGVVSASTSPGAELHAVDSAKSQARTRADVKWSWRKNYLLHSTYSKWRRKYFKGGESKAVCMVVHKGGRAIPIGMLTLVPDFTCKILDRTKERAFTWYLSDAPREFYSNALGLKKIKLIAHALVDYTVQAGIEVNQETTLVLRSDPDGGDRLREFYTNIGLAPLPDDHPAISTARFWNKDGYFTLMPEKSMEFCSAMDVYRASRTRNLCPVANA